MVLLFISRLTFPHPTNKQITYINEGHLCLHLSNVHEQSRYGTCHLKNKNQLLSSSINTHPASAAVFGGSYIFSDWVAFVQANGHRVADSHVCRTNGVI